ncbi:MAG: hypothetical protein LBO02_02165 [Holosporaceae bacterium]|jgi:hypothetical protein|nr:hypothetical protein [Holosporaceae bacterium]
MFKRVSCFAIGSLLCFCATAGEKNEAKDKGANVGNVESEKVDSFLNIKTAHERANNYPLGPKNTSAVALNPVLSFGNFVVEGDVYYGRQFTFTPFLRNNFTVVSPMTNNDRARLNSAAENTLDKAHFYRSYARGVYTDKEKDFRIVVGDTTTRNTVGFQTPLSGAGISIFRQSGNGSTINGGSPIVITRLSKVECKLGKQIVAVQLLRPGVYKISDLPEEAKLPGVDVKITDQLSRSEVVGVDYFGGYGTPPACKDDFDFTVVYAHKWNLDDPNRLRYQNKPRLSANYRFSRGENITAGVGLQARENYYLVDGTVIFSGAFGKIAPNIAYSDARWYEKSHRTVGAGIFYSLPENETGISLEIFMAAKGKGFGDVGASEDVVAEYNRLYDLYSAGTINFLPTPPSSSRQITARLYSKPVWGVTPGFIFNGAWNEVYRLREYTLSLTTTFNNNYTFTVAGGITYDDPFGGRNKKSPDRRLTVACVVDLGSELSIEGSYLYYDDEKRRSYGSITYAPEAVKGLELSAEYTRRPGLSNPCFTVKYNTAFFGLKVDENVVDQYEDKETSTNKKHANRQRAYLGTSLSLKGFSPYRSSGFNILRD